MKWEYEIFETDELLSSELNEYGDKGWELICCIREKGDLLSYKFNYVFKRPKEK